MHNLPSAVMSLSFQALQVSRTQFKGIVIKFS